MKHLIAVLFIFILTSCSNDGLEQFVQTQLPPTATPKPKYAPTAASLPADAPVAPEELFTAIDEGNLENVKSFFDGGLAIDAVEENGTTALMWAAATGQLEIMRYLIEQGAEMNLGRNSDQSTPLIFAVYFQQPEAVQLLIENGVEIDVASASGVTPLHLAADGGFAEIVTLLLEAGADPNLFTSIGTDTLWLAMRMEYVPIVQALLEHNADVNAHYGEGQPHPSCPLAVAAWVGNDDITKMLLDKGARDPWLSELPGFDPYDFQPLDVSLVDGEVRVSGGSMPLFLGAHSAQRPWVDPSTEPQDNTGTNFFTWIDASIKDEIVSLYIEDEAGHQSMLRMILPVFIGDEGILYTEGITHLLDNGPFVTVRVHTDAGMKGKVILHQGEGTIEKEIDAEGTTIFELSQVSRQNEPLTIEILNEAGTLADTIEIDCIWRGASEGVVFYDAYMAKP